jgi:hypothetical protein
MLRLPQSVRLRRIFFDYRRKRDREDNVVCVVSLKSQFTLVPVHNASGDCKTETGTTFFRSKERLKNLACHTGRDRRTRILNPDPKRSFGPPDGNENDPIWRRGFNGVAHQIQKYLLQLAFISIYATGIAHLGFNL